MDHLAGAARAGFMWLQYGCEQSDPQPTHALTQHAEGTSSREKPAQGLWMAETRAEDQSALRKTNHQSLHNSIRRPESMPRNGAPECCTQSSIVLNVQPRTQVISPGPVANGLTQGRHPAGALPATPGEAHASHASRSSLQQKHTPAESSSPPWKECFRAHGEKVRHRSRDHRNEPRVTLKLKLKSTGS